MGDVKKYEEVDCSFLDLYEHHIWMAQQNGGEFYKLVGYGYNRFLPDDYKNVDEKRRTGLSGKTWILAEVVD